VDGKLQPIVFVVLDNAGPAGSINSSVVELSKWALLQLGHGKLPDREERLFSEKQSREMWSAQTILPTGGGEGPLAALRPKFAAYGLGWALRDYKGRKLVGHTGGVAGFVSRVMLVPEENLAVIILTNAEEDLAFEAILYQVLDYYFDSPAADWTAAFKQAEDRERAEAEGILKKQSALRSADAKPSLPLAKYAGTYHDAWYGPATIRIQNGKLTFSLDHTPKAVGDLELWQFDTFKAHWNDRTMEDAFLTFTLKPDGSIDHFTMTAVSPLADFSFDYQDLNFVPVRGKN
jgi:hypothetical protein